MNDETIIVDGVPLHAGPAMFLHPDGEWRETAPDSDRDQHGIYQCRNGNESS